MEPSIPLVVRRTISAPRTTLFAAFINPRSLQNWFKPNNDVSVEILQHDFESQGRFRYRWTLPDDRTATVHGAFLDIEEPHQIVMSWQWQAPDPLEGVPMKVSFRFIEENGATDVIVTQEGIPSDTACTVHQDGWVGTLAQLADEISRENQA